MKLPKYLYVYRDINTVIQLYRDKDKIYIMDDGLWKDKVDFSLTENESCLNGINDPNWRCHSAKFESGDYWDIYANPLNAFHV